MVRRTRAPLRIAPTFVNKKHTAEECIYSRLVEIERCLSLLWPNKTLVLTLASTVRCK